MLGHGLDLDTGQAPLWSRWTRCRLPGLKAAVRSMTCQVRYMRINGVDCCARGTVSGQATGRDEQKSGVTGTGATSQWTSHPLGAPQSQAC